jgi:hypothetical protein
MSGWCEEQKDCVISVDSLCTHVVIKRSNFNVQPLYFPTSPLPPLPPQPPRMVLSPSVMHAPPSAWPHHHTLLDAPAVNVTLSDPHTAHLNLSLSASQPQPLGRVHAQDYLASFSAASRTTSRLRMCMSSPSHLSPLTSHPLRRTGHATSLILPSPSWTSTHEPHTHPHYLKCMGHAPSLNALYSWANTPDLWCACTHTCTETTHRR